MPSRAQKRRSMLALVTPAALISTSPKSRVWECVAVSVSPTSVRTVSSRSSGATLWLCTSILTNSSATATSSAGPRYSAGLVPSSAGQVRYAGS